MKRLTKRVRAKKVHSRKYRPIKMAKLKEQERIAREQERKREEELTQMIIDSSPTLKAVQNVFAKFGIGGIF